MLGAIVAIAVTVHVATATCDASVDLTLIPETNGSAVVDICIARISAVFTTDDQQMLRRIAYVETRYGNNPNTYSDASHNGGIWQLSESKYDATKDTSDATLNSLIQNIYAEFAINWTSTQWSDLRRPLYSALAARLYLQVISVSIPLSSNINDQATYWITYYTESGGTESDYVTAIDELNEQGCSVNALELFFVTDESGSVTDANYQIMKQFVYDITNAYEIGPDDVQVGLLSYSSSHTFQFFLNTYTTKSSILSAINALQYRGGGTNTAGALNAIRSEAFTEVNGARPASEGVPRVVIVITDGFSQNMAATLSAASGLHEDGYIVFAVGISGANIDELNGIASDPSYVSFVDSFDQNVLRALQQSISEEACVASPSFTTNDTVNGTIDSGRVQYINYPFDITNGTTIQVHVTFGEVVIYISTIISNPNEAFYDVVIEGGGYIDVYLSPATLCITTQTVYIAIVGSAGGNINSSEVSISAAIGDISTEPAMTTSGTPGEISATVGNSVSMECSASGRPLPSLSWYKDGVELDTSERISISTNNAVTSTLRINSTLMVNSVTLDDEAVYTCTAMNILPNGTATHSTSFTLDVNDDISTSAAATSVVTIIVVVTVVGVLVLASFIVTASFCIRIALRQHRSKC